MSIWYTAAGGGWGAETEGWWPRLSLKWRTLVAEGNIPRSAGVRSDPWAMLRPRKLAAGGECKGETLPMNIPNNGDSSLKDDYVTTHFGVAAGARFMFVWPVADLYRFALISRYNQPDQTVGLHDQGKVRCT